MSTTTTEATPTTPERGLESRIHPSRELRYMEQGCPMTLREGLGEYYTQIDDLITEDNASAEVAALFRYHDTTHVLFGCDTSIAGETLADTWSIFGTDVTIRGYLKYLEIQETQDVFAALGTWTALGQMVRALPLMPRAIWRASRMKRKWPFRNHEAYLDRPLSEIRDELGIRVIHP